MKKAISTFKLCNRLYRDVKSESIDETTKHIIKVSNTSTTSKATKDDVASFQAYIIRTLDNKLSPT